VTFVTRALLEGKALADFRARIRSLTAIVAPGAALTPIARETGRRAEARLARRCRVEKG
jgi:hypothetical protein